MTPPDRRDWPSTLRLSLLALTPLVIHWVTRVFAAPRPFWAYFFDPEAMYFFSSLEILSGAAPTDIDNPGTPVQLLGAVIALFTGKSPLSIPVFLVVGHCLSLAATAGGVVLLARRVFPKLPSIAFLGVVWLYFLCPQALTRSVIWGVEPFQFGAGAVALWLLVSAFEAPERARGWLAAGAAVGFLCALKFTFLGWVPALLLAVAWSSRREFAAGFRRLAVCTAGALSGFLLGTLPAWTRLPSMVDRVFSVATRGGTPPWVGADTTPLSYLDGLLLPLRSGTTWFGLLACVTVMAVVALRRRDSGDDGARGRGGLAVFALVAIVGTHLAAAREPYLRYFLPTAPTAVLLAAVGLASLRSSALRWVGVTFGLVVALLLARQIWMDLAWHAQITAEHRLLRFQTFAAVTLDADEGAEPVVLYGGRFPHPAFALLLFSRTEEQRAEIGAAYPHSGWFDRRSGRIWLPPGTDRWDYLVLEEHDLARFPETVGKRIATLGEDLPTTPVYHVVSRPR